MRKPKRITDPTFKYTPAVSTDISKTFKRVRQEIKAAQEAEKARVVVPMPHKKGGT